MKKNKKFNKGVALFNLVSMVLIVLIIVYCYFIVVEGLDRKKINIEINNIIKIIKKVESSKMKSDVSELNNNKVNTMGIIFDSESEFKMPVVQGVDANSYKIEYDGMSADRCKYFGPKVQFRLEPIQKFEIKINGKEFKGTDSKGMEGACYKTDNKIELIVFPPNLDINPIKPQNEVVLGIK